jgi:hypothetical protein
MIQEADFSFSQTDVSGVCPNRTQKNWKYKLFKQIILIISMGIFEISIRTKKKSILKNFESEH